jgi:hypothetical protein
MAQKTLARSSLYLPLARSLAFSVSVSPLIQWPLKFFYCVLSSVRSMKAFFLPHTHACMSVCLYACMPACMHACVWMDACMCAWMYVCVRACMHACMYACMHVGVCVCMHVCMHAGIYACLCIMYVGMHACVHACMQACVHVCMCACECMYVCVLAPHMGAMHMQPCGLCL